MARSFFEGKQSAISPGVDGMSLHAPVLSGESFLQAKDLGLFHPPLDWNFQRMLDEAVAELPRNRTLSSTKSSKL